MGGKKPSLVVALVPAQNGMENILKKKNYKKGEKSTPTSLEPQETFHKAKGKKKNPRLVGSRKKSLEISRRLGRG